MNGIDSQVMEQIAQNIARDTAIASAPAKHPRDARMANGRICAFENYREFLSAPITQFDTCDPRLIEAVEELEAITSQGEPTREDHPEYGFDYSDPRVEGTRFKFLGSGMHRLAYLDARTGYVIKRLHDFGDRLLEEAFWAEEKQSLALFDQNASAYLKSYAIRYAETFYHTLDSGRTFMIQEYFELHDDWLDGDLHLSQHQEQFFSLPFTGISQDLCTLNCAREGPTIVLFDMLVTTYDAYMHVGD